MDFNNFETQFYSTQSKFSDPRNFAHLFNNLPDNVQELCDVVHGLILQRDYTDVLYNFEATEKRKEEADLRYVNNILQTLIDHENTPLTNIREPKKRVFGTCRDFALLLTSILRHKGIPARIRFGFASYFKQDWYEDHVLCEYYNGSNKRWTLVDAELGYEEKKINTIDFNPTDVPISKFINAGSAWKLIRKGNADPNFFGVPPIDLKGSWFVLSSVVRDTAALNKVELLPWDYTEFSRIRFDKYEERTKEDINLVDEVAEYISSPSVDMDSIQNIYKSDTRLSGNNTVISYSIAGKKVINL